MKKEISRRILEGDGSGRGVRNVHQRIQVRYGKQYGLEILSGQSFGTWIQVRIPWVPVPEPGKAVQVPSEAGRTGPAEASQHA